MSRRTGPGRAGAAARPALDLSLQFVDRTDRALLARHRVARWIRAALEVPAEFAVRIVGAEEGRALNRDFRGRDYATDVLTFVYGETPSGAGAGARPLRADLVLCAPVVGAAADADGIDREAHYAHLIVHGTLHAQGFDHERAAQARRMRSRESAILVGLGFADPWAPPPGGGRRQRPLG